MKFKINKKNETLTETNRHTEKWFRRGLWLLSFIFASFLIGLGGKIVNDLPKVESQREWESYVSPDKLNTIENAKKSWEAKRDQHEKLLAQAKLALEKQENETQAQREKFAASLATRHTTGILSENERVFERTKEYEQLIDKERQLNNQVTHIRQEIAAAEAQMTEAERGREQLEAEGRKLKEIDDRKIELKIFLYRLALTLPLLLVAAWLFKTQRHSRWFPFVWGFIFFALFAFFVELVPYLPSYGGYVRYFVGIVGTLVVGKYAINAMYRYLEQKQAQEALPATERAALNYELAQSRLSKHICPACERPLDFSNPQMDFCPHCSTRLFQTCVHCQTRSSAFNRYCYQCGAATKSQENIS